MPYKKKYDGSRNLKSIKKSIKYYIDRGDYNEAKAWYVHYKDFGGKLPYSYFKIKDK